jgi:hypothetical protein
MYFNIIHSLSFYYSLHPPLFSSNSSFVGNMFSLCGCVCMHIWQCLYLYLYLCSTYERKYVTFVFVNWLTAHNMKFSSSFYLPVNYKISLFFMAEKYSNIYIHIHTYIHLYMCANILHISYIFLIHSSVVGHLGYFPNLAIVNYAAVNIGVQVSILYLDIHSFWYIHRSGTTGSYDYILRNLYTAFYSGCANFIFLPTR